ncbi:MAG: carboxypeptidase regulatory-like domain-containing protein, partial [Planctomycetales bacterium]|nr:carboxypeptidase regulatory-like domain-containing protein [Planctomycetales bacterium]
FAYLDVNRNGTRDNGDTPLPNVAIALSGTETGSANAVTRQTTTDANGAYTFSNLLPGTYQIVQTQPTEYKDGQTNVGTGATGLAGTNQITTIQLGSGANAQAFNFGELQPDLSKRRFLASS